ncbi:uncharacterized protein SOCE836_069830 [Sorangium cellulosum]|uniref:Uncharacterized protein n=1 Tax=Sorangium cellulosum TaxID=56 RepID=A0A4P2QXA0_SORCE|nr:uncharacterized protein SOCE836_069830 [Sorangium cellulosum]WCQ94118.1 hypothetical protein NQZ70_06875 [Sorangium sp. Soce836]
MAPCAIGAAVASPSVGPGRRSPSGAGGAGALPPAPARGCPAAGGPAAPAHWPLVGWAPVW